MLLIDFGNTHANIYDDNGTYKVSIKEFKAPIKKFYYINVNLTIKSKIENLSNAVNLDKYIKLKTNYKGLGVDRKALCSFIDDGIIVDAGSAITIDVMDKGSHKGGFILLGINSYYKTYENISSALKQVREINFKHDIDRVPTNTKEAIEFAIFKSIVMSIKDISKDKKIYFCGGDGLELSQYFKDAIFNENLMFDAMKKIIKESGC